MRNTITDKEIKAVGYLFLAAFTAGLIALAIGANIVSNKQANQIHTIQHEN